MVTDNAFNHLGHEEIFAKWPWDNIYNPISTIFEMIKVLYVSHLCCAQQACVTEIHEAANNLLTLFNLLNRRNGNFFSSNKKPYVLLVEDNNLIITIHKKLLTELNCNVDVAVNGMEAINMADNHYDLILIDVGLPDISGIEVAKAISKRLKDQCPPLVAITALSSLETKKSCLESGISEVHTKPVDSRIFKQIIQKHIILEEILA